MRFWSLGCGCVDKDHGLFIGFTSEASLLNLLESDYAFLSSVDGEVFCEEGIITSNVLAAALTNNDIAWLNSLSAEQFDAEAFSG
jgi:hypothetical protein